MINQSYILQQYKLILHQYVSEFKLAKAFIFIFIEGIHGSAEELAHKIFVSIKGDKCMTGRYIMIIAVIIMFIFVGISCDEQKNEDPLINTAEGGSLLITGTTIDDNKEINQPETTFKANEDFYLYFNNNDQFSTDRVIVQLINSANDKVLAESDYDVEPESNTITDMIWFGSSGRYQIKVIVDGEVRAVREVIVE